MRSKRCFSTLPLLAIYLTTGSTRAAQIHVPGDYPTIQAAVDAASDGDTIQVAAGVYVEQVTIIDKDLALIGEPGATIQAFPTMVENLAPYLVSRIVLGAFRSAVQVEGFTFDGRGLSAPGYFLVGVYLAASDGVVRNCQFIDFRSEPFGLEFGRGIAAFNLVSWDASQRDVTVLDCTFLGCHDSIVIGGDDVLQNERRITAHVRHNTVVGQGPGPSTQRGIWLPFGVGGEIESNTVTDHVFNSGSDFAVGILVGTQPEASFPLVVPRVLVRDNALSNNIVGLACLFGVESQIVNNEVVGGMLGFNGIAVSGDGNRVVNNVIDMRDSVLPGNSGVALLGLEFGGPAGYGMATDTKVIANVILGADLPIWVQTGASGTKTHGNRITP